MLRHLVTFRSDMNLFTAINRLLEHRISGAPVVDGGCLIGQISRSDVLRAVKEFAQYDQGHVAFN